MTSSATPSTSLATPPSNTGIPDPGLETLLGSPPTPPVPPDPQIPPTRHQQLGLTDQQLLDMFTDMLAARKIDERMFALNRQGRAPFVVGSSGHEGVQVASVFALDRETDWVLPYYRDLGVAVSWGFDLTDIFRAVFGRGTDPFSGGRQHPNHWSSPDLRVFTQSSPIGTQFQHGAGIAHGLDIQSRPGVVVVYAGEGATSEGDWHEAMNWAGIHRLPYIVIIENNLYAISVTPSEGIAGQLPDRAQGYGMVGEQVDGNDPLEVYEVVRKAADRARAGEGGTLIEAITYRYFAHTSDDDDRLYRSSEEVSEWQRNDPLVNLKRYLIEHRLLPEDLEQNIVGRIEQDISLAVEKSEHEPVPNNPDEYVYARKIPAPATPATLEPPPVGEEVNLITAVNRTLHEIMENFPETVLFGQDVAGEKGGVFKATVGLTERFGQERCFNAPISEAAIIGAAIGMTATGLLPLAEIQFADYIHPAFNQIVSEAARIHYRSHGAWSCPLVIRAPFGGGIHGGLHHSQSVESFFTHVPGLKVVVPSTPADVKGLLWAAVKDPDPVLVLEPKKLYRLGKGTYPEEEWEVPFGQAAVRREGKDLTLLAYGAMSHFAQEAGEELTEQGISAEIIDLRSLKPLDWVTISASVRKTNRVLIVHEDNQFMGYGAELAARLVGEEFEWLDAPVRRYAPGDLPTMPYAHSLEEQIYPNTAGIVKHAQQVMAF